MRTSLIVAILWIVPTTPFQLAVLSLLIAIFVKVTDANRFSGIVRIADTRDAVNRFAHIFRSMELEEACEEAELSAQESDRLLKTGDGSTLVWWLFGMVDTIVWIVSLIYALLWSGGYLGSQ